MPLTFEQIAPYLVFEKDSVHKPSRDFRHQLPNWYNQVVIISDRGIKEEYRGSPIYYIGVLYQNDRVERWVDEDCVRILTHEGFKYLRFYHFQDIILLSLSPSEIFDPED